MEIALWLVLIHVVELVILGGYLLIKKNSKMEKIIIAQQDHINNISYIVDQSDKKLEELDASGAFKSDDEIGFFFEQLKAIQSELSNFK